jgi:hypothetical protein
MDAGLAAVLGATVGAIGTGGASIAAGFFTRSQVRMQIRAETARMVREPRKTAYVAYAEAFLKVMAGLDDSLISVQIASEEEQAESRTELGQEAEEEYEGAIELFPNLDHALALVSVEGPPRVNLLAVKAARDLAVYRRGLIELIHTAKHGDLLPRDALLSVEDARDATNSSNNAFLAAAQTAIEPAEL